MSVMFGLRLPALNDIGRKIQNDDLESISLGVYADYIEFGIAVRRSNPADHPFTYQAIVIEE
jgi:hypothetical protein